jgi:hypothetical protein
MRPALLSASRSASSGGHPVWHLAILAAAALVVFACIKATEAWQQRARPLPRPTLAMLSLAALSAASASIHAAICPEHLREWVPLGVAFMLASAAQAGWALLILLRPSRPALGWALLGNTAVVLVYVVSRTSGLPVGPEAFRPESLTALGIAATGCELAIVAVAAQILHRSRRQRVRIASMTLKLSPT